MRGFINSPRMIVVAPEHDSSSDTAVGINERNRENIGLSDLQEQSIPSDTPELQECNGIEDVERYGDNSTSSKLPLDHYLEYLHYVGLASFHRRKRPSVGCIIQKVLTLIPFK